MAIYSNGKLVDSSLIFSAAQILDDATAGLDSTNTVYFGGGKSNKLQVNVAVASATFSIAQNESLTIAIQYGTNSSPTTSLRDMIYTYKNTAGAEATAQGTLLCQYTIPGDKVANYDYAKLVYTTSADEGDTNDALDAWISIVP